MKYGGLDYIDLKYKPKNNDLIVEYYLEPEKGFSFKEVAEAIAAESSIGTWTDLSTMNEKIARELKPHVFYLNPKKRIVKIAYNINLFEKGNMSGLLSSIAGNIYGMKEVKSLRLEDISFPKEFINSFPGPLYGLEGIRRITKIYDRPLLGTIVKPKVGLTPEEHARVAYEAWIGGLDVVKDDENLTSLPFNNFNERMKLTFAMRDKAEKESGQKKIYLPNITAPFEEMRKRAELVKALGGEYIMVDVLTVGWSALQSIRRVAEELNLLIHAHRAMHAALTKKKNHGISMLALAKIYRLCGVDQIHIGTANVGKMEETVDEALILEYELEHQKISNKDELNVLYQNWFNIKPVMAVASGGLNPLSIPKLMKIMGKDVIMQFGGGCHGHPLGTRAGAKAIVQALEAAMKGFDLKDYAETNRELELAFEKWGLKKSKNSKRKNITKSSSNKSNKKSSINKTKKNNKNKKKSSNKSLSNKTRNNKKKGVNKGSNKNKTKKRKVKKK